METLDHKIGYLFFTRHGERADDKKVKETDRIKFSGDPPISKRGIGDLESQGGIINNYIRNDLGYEGGITLISSPFIRTLQTAAAIRSSLENPIVCYDKDGKTVKENTCLVNPSIGLGLSKGNFKADPVSKLLYNAMDQKKLLKEYCKDRFTLANDHNMTVKAPKYPETKHKSRYKEGFMDIAKQHFVKDKNFKLGDTKVVMLFSHSDGFTPFLQLYDKNLESEKPCYGATVAIKYIIDSEGKMTADSLNHIIE